MVHVVIESISNKIKYLKYLFALKSVMNIRRNGFNKTELGLNLTP